MKTWHAWIRYLRLPNVLSVPGDVLAGAALAGAMDPSLLLRLPAVCLAYLFGMALNDLVDYRLDQRERPERPLPSGAVPLPAARVVCALLGIGAFALHPGETMALLLFTIVSYTCSKERFPLLGAVQMGLCRMLAVWIGAGGAVPPPDILILVMGLWGLFIFFVTRIASFETKADQRTRLPYLIPVLFCVAGAAWVWIDGYHILLNLFSLPAILSCITLNEIRKRGGRIAPKNIGQLLGLLYWMQIIVLLLQDYLWFALGIFLLSRLQRRLRRSIPAS